MRKNMLVHIEEQESECIPFIRLLCETILLAILTIRACWPSEDSVPRAVAACENVKVLSFVLA